MILHKLNSRKLTFPLDKQTVWSIMLQLLLMFSKNFLQKCSSKIAPNVYNVTKTIVLGIKHKVHISSEGTVTFLTP